MIVDLKKKSGFGLKYYSALPLKRCVDGLRRTFVLTVVVYSDTGTMEEFKWSRL
jgi:hypothetical protein